MAEYQDIDTAAKDLAGNWQKFDSFGWLRQFDLKDPDNWCIVYTSNRDSTLLEQSNAAAIEAELEPFCAGEGALDPEDPDCVSESHNHWAVGHVDGYSIRVYNAKGEITPAFSKYIELQCSLADYPALNEMDYSRREYEATLENIESVGRCYVREDAPEDWAAQVFSWFWANNQGAVENTDGSGGYPTGDEMVEALEALGFAEQDDES